MVMRGSWNQNGVTGAHANPLVSVLLPAYNCAGTIGETLDSVISQTYPNVEIVVVDDGSTDATEAVVHQYKNRVRYFRKTNGGVGSARNRAQREARGDYQAWLDSDDICEPDRLALQVGYLESSPDIVLCSSDFSAFENRRQLSASYIGAYYSIVDRTPGGIAGIYPQRRSFIGRDVPWASSSEAAPISTFHGRIYERLVWGNFIHPPTVMVRRSTVSRVGEFNETYRVVCEYDWLIRASRLGPIGFIDRPLLRYRVWPGQLSGDPHTAWFKLETVSLMRAVRECDPDLYREHQSEFRRRIGEAHRGAADSLAETQWLVALRELAQSISFRKSRPGAFRTLLKIVMPRVMLRSLRQLRGRLSRRHLRDDERKMGKIR